MSLLWKNAAAHQREAMAWHVEPGEENYAHSAKSVRHAGFTGYVDHDADTLAEYNSGNEDHEEGFNENLWDESSPDPTTRQQRHQDEHGEYPQSYYDRHDEAYEKAKQNKAQEDVPDHEDNALMHFVGNHGTNTAHWQQHGEYGAVNLKQPVYATQSHVSQAHIDKYHADPGAMSHHQMKYQHMGKNNYLGDGAPMFVTHEGRLHAIEGHHRTAAALQRGDSHIMGWHYNADQHGGFPDEDGNMPGHEDYYDPYE